jgi:putative pyruvate formate lyase activating enzyme
MGTPQATDWHATLMLSPQDKLVLVRQRLGTAREMLRECRICPRDCGVNRLEGELGYCGTGARMPVSSAGPHYGEEPPLVGRGGSGTIFVSNCNLSCVFCQNSDISQEGRPAAGRASQPDPREVGDEELGRIMLELQAMGCENINFVTPTHVVPQILGGLRVALEGGLSLPLVYNCGGYEFVETLQLLRGIFDIYMPDMKYSDPEIAHKLSDTPPANDPGGKLDYVTANRRAVQEMHSQVGVLRGIHYRATTEDDARLRRHNEVSLDEQGAVPNLPGAWSDSEFSQALGIARVGLLVRHLVLPGGLAGTREVAEFLAEELSRDTYINVMDQYRPCYRANETELVVQRRLTHEEYEDAVEIARSAGLHRFAH